MVRGANLNDSDRTQWIANHEGLYNWRKESRLSVREFIRQNRAEIDAAIIAVRDAPPAQKTWRGYK